MVFITRWMVYLSGYEYSEATQTTPKQRMCVVW
jgi:hypothetical protein